MTTQERELQKKKTHILMLFMLAEADNEQHEYEEMFINSIGARLGFTEAEVRDIDKNPQEITFIIPKAEHERMVILYDLLFLMKFDGIVDQTEIDLINRLSFRMGFRNTMVNEMINKVSEYIGQVVPKGALLSIVKKYMN
jgi:hypothetical protein